MGTFDSCVSLTMALKLVASALIGLASGIELTSDSWDAAVAGKTVFVKFFAPWCGHCKRMKPDWDKLMAEFKDSKSALVADVDCTAGGKPLCDANGVRGFPTLKHGDPNNLEDYKGGRDFDSLKKFATDNLGPTCGPNNLDLCDDEKKALVKKFMAMSGPDLDAEITKKDDEMKAAEKELEDLLKGLHAQYEEGQKKKDDTKKAIKESGLGLMKSVLAHRKTAKGEL